MGFEEALRLEEDGGLRVTACGLKETPNKHLPPSSFSLSLFGDMCIPHDV